jgi:hypothetical protein
VTTAERDRGLGALADLARRLHSVGAPDVGRELVSSVDLLGSRRALRAMSDAELADWMRACWAMLARPGRASTAQRRWRQLLADASSEQAVRRRRQDLGHDAPAARRNDAWYG